MALNNQPAAEALLKLFGIDKTWDEFSQAAQDLEAEQIRKLIMGVDKRRKDELFDSLPSIKLLEDAYAKGIRIKLSHDAAKPDTISYCLQKGIGEISTSYSGYYICEAFWQDLHQRTFGSRHPDFDMMSLGEYALNFISQKIAQENATFGGVSMFSTGFDMQRTFGITAISKSKLAALSDIMRDVFTQLGHPDVKPEIKLDERTEPCFNPTSTSFFGLFTHEQERIKALLEISARAPSVAALSSVDLHKALERFRQEMENIPSKDRSLISDDVTFSDRTIEHTKFSVTLSSNYI